MGILVSEMNVSNRNREMVKNLEGAMLTDSKIPTCNLQDNSGALCLKAKGRDSTGLLLVPS